jgi:hypothetical protein
MRHPEGEGRAGRIWAGGRSALPDPSARPSLQDDSRLRRLVLLIAAHSLSVGILLTFFPAFAVHFAGWTETVTPLFFARQGGVFHFVVAAAYLIEYFAYRGVSILLTAKAIAVLFLGAQMMMGPLPWAVAFSAAADAGMGISVWLIARQARRPVLPPSTPPL